MRCFNQVLNGSRTKIVSSRCGDVLTSATGQRISSSIRRTYLIAFPRRSAQLSETFAPLSESLEPPRDCPQHVRQRLTPRGVVGALFDRFRKAPQLAR